LILKRQLKRAGIVTGPLTKNTSYSGLAVIRRMLLSQPQFRGSEEFLREGNALHEKFLLRKSTIALPEDKHTTINLMVEKLDSHPVVRALVADSVREEKLYVKLNGIQFAFILDIHQKSRKIGSDLKTTKCKTFQSFVSSAIEYGYFKQAVAYIIAAKLKNFFFIGIQKEPPFNIYILDVHQYQDELAYAERELEFLLYFYRHYGTLNKSNTYNEQNKGGHSH